MTTTRRAVEAMRRLHATLGVPGLIIGLFSVLSFGFGLVVLAREYDLLRDSGRRALRPILTSWVRSTPVHYLGWTLPDYVDQYHRSSESGRAARGQEARLALNRLGEDFDRPSRRIPLFSVVSLGIREPDGTLLGAWSSRTAATADAAIVYDHIPLFVKDAEPPSILVIGYRLAPEVAPVEASLESSYHRLVLAVSGLSGYSLLCLAYMVIQARSLSNRAAREAAQAATLDLADRTCHELGNVAFVLANERANLAHHLDLVDRFVTEEEAAFRFAAKRTGLDEATTARLLKALRQEYGQRGIGPGIEIRSDAAVARDVCRQIAVCSDYISLTVRELDAYLKESSLPVALATMDLRICLEDALALLAPTLDTTAATIDRRIESRVLARGDRRLLVHALVNVLKNAIEAATAADRTPAVIVSVRTEGAMAWIEITDNGPGIPANDLARIFDNGVSTKGPGRGRGLAIVRDSIAAQSGELLVDSTVGVGTRFRIGLPVGGPS